MLTYPNSKLVGAVAAHFRGRLATVDAMVAHAISLHLRDESSEFGPSLAELAEILGLQRRATLRALARLRAEGVFSVKSGGGRTTNRYRVGPALAKCVVAGGGAVSREAPAAVHVDARSGAPECPGAVHAGTPVSIDTRTETTTPPKAPRRGASEPDGFAEFYAAYPWKAKRPKAAAAFRAAMAKASCAAIMAGLAKWRASEDWRAEDGRFIPMPASWLNAERWNDAPRRMLATLDAPPELPAPVHEMIDNLAHLRRGGNR